VAGGDGRRKAESEKKMKTNFAFFLFIALSGCGCDERPYELWLDSACSPNDQEVIRDAVDVLNAWTLQELGEELIEIGGIDKVDHEKALTSSGTDPNWGRDFVICFSEKPDGSNDLWTGLSGHAYQGGDIWLFLFVISSDQKLSRTTLHELGHHIGLPHTDKEPAVMHNPPNSDSFTDYDSELLCEKYNCRKGGAR
jgi:hypothetical protein